MEDSIDTYKRVFEQLRVTEHTKDDLITVLIERLEHLSGEVSSTRMDYERERQFNRQGQLKEARMEQEIRNMKQEHQRDPFVLVLIDGDGMIFEDHLIQLGETGGKEAANHLWTGIRNHIQTVAQEIPLHFKIVTRVYANLKGLGDACHRASILDRPTMIEDFARGFTGSKQLFDFVDVGSGKDRADEKITEMMKLHLSNINCQHVVFGCSHDNGYARLLEDVAESQRQKITLLEGVPFERELRGFLEIYETVKFPGLFRSSKVPSFYPQQYTMPSAMTMQGLRAPPGLSMDQNGMVSNGNMGSYISSNGSADTSNSIPQSPLANMAQPSESQNTLTRIDSNKRSQTPSSAGTWADKVTSSAPPQTIQTQGAAPPSPPTIPRNKYLQRIDPLMPKTDPNEMKRVSRIKMCNVHYLRKDCPYGNDCTHDHSYKPTKQELELLKQINRGTPCRFGTGCEELKCMYGHRCPHSVEGQKTCKFTNNCRFGAEMHGVDTKVVRTTKV